LRSKAEIKIPIPVAIIGGFTIFGGIRGVLNLIFMSTIKFPGAATFQGVLVFIKLFVFLLSLVSIFLGISLLNLQSWARRVLLWCVVIAGASYVLRALLAANVKAAILFGAISAALYLLYYFGLNKDYFQD